MLSIKNFTYFRKLIYLQLRNRLTVEVESKNQNDTKSFHFYDST